MDNDAKAGVAQPLTIGMIPEGDKDAPGEQVVKSSSAGSKFMVLDTVLKECGLMLPAYSGSTKNTPEMSELQLLELERQRWLEVSVD